MSTILAISRINGALESVLLEKMGKEIEEYLTSQPVLAGIKDYTLDLASCNFNQNSSVNKENNSSSSFAQQGDGIALFTISDGKDDDIGNLTIKFHFSPSNTKLELKSTDSLEQYMQKCKFTIQSMEFGMEKQEAEEMRDMGEEDEELNERTERKSPQHKNKQSHETVIDADYEVLNSEKSKRKRKF